VLSVRTAHQNANKLLRPFTLFVFILVADGEPHAFYNVLPDDLGFDSGNCCAYSLKLSNDVDGTAVIFDHSLDATDLAFDPAKPVQHFRLLRHKLSPFQGLTGSFYAIRNRRE
jgi:hypothetical protein